MPYFEVVADVRGTSELRDRARFAGTYTIARRRAFVTLEQAVAAIREDRAYPDADKYAVEADTSRQAAAELRAALGVRFVPVPPHVRLIKEGGV